MPNIPGANALNTITFDGGNGNKATRIISFSPSAAPNWHVVRFDACNYVTFRNLTIQSTSSSGAWVAHFFNGSNNRINNCTINLTGNSIGSSNFTGVVINGNKTNVGTVTSIGNNHLLDSNAINLNGAYYGIFTAASGGGSNTFKFFYNTINNAYQYGCFFQNNHVIKFNNNTINFGTYITSSIGVYMPNNNLTGLNFHEINGNKFVNVGQTGALISTSSGSSSVQSQLYNNMMVGFKYSSGAQGIQLQSSSNWNIYHNSINFDIAASSLSACVYINFGTGINVQNNILTVSNASSNNSFPLYVNPSGAISTLNYNNYLNASSTNLLQIAAVNYTTANYKAAYPTGGGANSINEDPLFVSSTDLHITDGCNNGANLGLTVDFDGNARGSLPDIGADEIVASVDNLAMVAIVSPITNSVSAGPVNITVRIKNQGSNTVNTGNVSYILNGGSPVTISIPSSIAPCDTMTVTFTGVMMSTGTNNFTAFTSQPNGNTDTYFGNDTIKTTYCTSLNGTYTIGGASPDYANFNAAVAALNCGGVSGKVIFNVRAGTYNEAIQINSIYGSNDTNTVTFQSESGIPSSVTLQNNTGTAFTLKIFNGDNIIIRNMKIAAGNNPTTRCRL
ncbi:MAG: hypothetical protein IPK03_09120 [Bacteroidetes bacterium]|nr:hypothetical protein [Bacteroidota bacterium]